MELINNKAPAIVRVQPKSLYTIDDEAKAISRAVNAARYIDVPLPVFHGRGQIGWTLGHQMRSDVLYMPSYRSMDSIQANGFPSYDSIISAISQSQQRYPAFWSKNFATAPVASNWYDLWPVGGNPQQGTYAGTASTSLQFTTSSVGALATFGNVSPLIKCLSSYWAIASAGVPPPVLIAYDRCVTYENVPFNNNAINTFTQSNSPVSLRYSTGTDSGNKIIITCQTVESATAQSVTQMAYTNQAGLAAQAAPCSTTTTNIIVSAATPTATLGARVVSPCATSAGTTTTSPFMPLAVGDTGVQQITSFTTSASAINTGKLCFVMGRPLFTLPMATAGIASIIDGINMIANLERVFDGACLTFLAYFPVATATILTGGVDFIWN